MMMSSEQGTFLQTFFFFFFFFQNCCHVKGASCLIDSKEAEGLP